MNSGDVNDVLALIDSQVAASGRKPEKIVLLVGAGYVGSASVRAMVAEVERMGYAVEVATENDNPFVKNPPPKLLAFDESSRVVSPGRHGGGKGRKAHKKRAAIFGHGWQ